MPDRGKNASDDMRDFKTGIAKPSEVQRVVTNLATNRIRESSKEASFELCIVNQLLSRQKRSNLIATGFPEGSVSTAIDLATPGPL